MQVEEKLLEIADFLKQTLHITDETLIREIVPMCEVKTFKKGKTLVRQGQVPDHVDLLVTGVCRGYFVDGNGKDITDCLVCQVGAPLTASADLCAPAPVTMETLTECVTVRISVGNVLYLLAHFPEIERVYRDALLASGDFHRELKITLYQYTAPQRYHWFLKKFPGVIHRISHKYVASLLNMTPVTLSRIINTAPEDTCDEAPLFNMPEPM